MLTSIKKLPRVVRFDDSDLNVYEPVAEPGEWAVTGSFAFWDAALETLDGKQRQAFNHGFLGIASFGWATLVAVAEPDPTELKQVVETLATRLVERYGAPDLPTALPAAREELQFAADLCAEHPVNTLLAIQRSFDGAEITETFKVIRPPAAAGHDAVRLWGIDAYQAG